jgi:preprotein translocase subunit SecF
MAEDEEGSLEEWMEKLEERGIDEAEIERLRQRDDVDVSSQAYRQYQEEEKKAREKVWYERFVSKASFFEVEFEDMKEGH